MWGKALAVAVGVTTLTGLAGCRDRGNDSGALTTSERRYCTLVKEFADHLPNVPKGSDPDQFTAAMSTSMAKGAKYFDDLQKVAPAEIKPDVDAAIAVLRRVATGDITAYEGLNLTKADQWEEDHCTKS
jgi:hypothetical protein